MGWNGRVPKAFTKSGGNWTVRCTAADLDENIVRVLEDACDAQLVESKESYVFVDVSLGPTRDCAIVARIPTAGYHAITITAHEIPDERLAEEGARLGTAEIVLTIFTTAAAKALIDIVALQLRQYIATRVASTKGPLRLRVAIRKDRTSPSCQQVIGVGDAAGTVIDRFVSNVCEAVKKAVIS